MPKKRKAAPNGIPNPFNPQDPDWQRKKAPPSTTPPTSSGGRTQPKFGVGSTNQGLSSYARHKSRVKPSNQARLEKLRRRSK